LDSHELCTTDLKYNSPIRGVSLLIPGLTIDKLVSAFIMCNAFSTYPNLLLVIQVGLHTPPPPSSPLLFHPGSWQWFGGESSPSGSHTYKLSWQILTKNLHFIYSASLARAF